MIFVVTAENRAHFEPDIIEMHRQRKTVFVDGAHWNVPVVAGLEMDRHDHANTTYLLAKAAPDSEVLASARLLPTVGPHLMHDLMSPTSQIPYPCGPRVLEISRFCPSPRLHRRARLQMLWEITCGVMETALLFGVNHVVFAANKALLPLALNCGWRAKILGRIPHDDFDETTIVAASITPGGLRCVRQRHNVPIPITRFHTDVAFNLWRYNDDPILSNAQMAPVWIQHGMLNSRIYTGSITPDRESP